MILPVDSCAVLNKSVVGRSSRTLNKMSSYYTRFVMLDSNRHTPATTTKTFP